jgi:broad specificity phosphatase PhoE
MKLIILRHAETEANVARINPGNNSTKLTGRGVLQAKQSGSRLAGEGISVIYSSDLGRARDTLLGISEFVSAPVFFAPELRERQLGIFTGKPYGSFKTFVKENNLDLFSYTPAGGESINDSMQRISCFLKQCLSKHDGQTILWISHGSVLKRLLVECLGKGAAACHDSQLELHPGNCEISIIEFDRLGNCKVCLLNCKKHLELSYHEPLL